MLFSFQKKQIHQIQKKLQQQILPVQPKEKQLHQHSKLKIELLLISRIHWIKPLYNGFLDASTANGTLFANNIESFSMGGEAAFTFGSNWGIALGATAPVFGKIVFKGTSFSGGFFINY